MYSNKDDPGSSESLKLAAQKLPVFAYRDQFMRLIDENQTLVVVGETGSGKTTQLPQWCWEYLRKKGSNSVVACTQPRRLAAMSVSLRVSKEMGVTLGQEVGYSVRFDSLTSSATTLKYLTDGMILREAVFDPDLKDYAIIIVDEAHERTLQSDVLMGVLKRALVQRNSLTSGSAKLKIIVMSATMNISIFQNYFNDVNVLAIAGRQHSIQNFFATNPQSDLLVSTLIAVFQLHRTTDEGDILVFCSGQDEIHSLVSITMKILKEAPESLANLIALPLYASLPAKNQMKVFEELHSASSKINQSKNCVPRRVIFATNVAETSITVPNIKYVIDTGFVKTKIHCPKTGLESMKIMRISKSQAIQRAGRAGRVRKGFCYRLFTRNEFQGMADELSPEIKRCNLDSTVLQIIAIGFSNIDNFEFLDRPADEQLQESLEHLIDLRAIRLKNQLSNGNGVAIHQNGDNLSHQSKKINHLSNGVRKISINSDYELTPLGKKLSALPLDPGMGKVVLIANELGCLDEALTVISLLYIENLFHILPNQRAKADAILDKFKTNEGDLIMLLKVYRAFKNVNKFNKANIKRWCAEHYIHIKSLKMACHVRKQLSQICRSMQLKPSSCGLDTSNLRKAFTYGLINNVAQMNNGVYRNKYNNHDIDIHPSSCLFKCKPQCILYVELIESNKYYMRNCSVIDINWLRDAITGKLS